MGLMAMRVSEICNDVYLKQFKLHV